MTCSALEPGLAAAKLQLKTCMTQDMTLACSVSATSAARPVWGALHVSSGQPEPACNPVACMRANGGLAPMWLILFLSCLHVTLHAACLCMHRLWRGRGARERAAAAAALFGGGPHRAQPAPAGRSAGARPGLHTCLSHPATQLHERVSSSWPQRARSALIWSTSRMILGACVASRMHRWAATKSSEFCA